MPKKRFLVSLTSEERRKLVGIVSKGQTATRIQHANILLAADENGVNVTDDDIARSLSCHRNTVANIRQRFAEEGLDAALNRKKRETAADPHASDAHRDEPVVFKVGNKSTRTGPTTLKVAKSNRVHKNAA